MKKLLIYIYILMASGILVNCAQDAATIDPSSLNTTETSAAPGTTLLTLDNFSFTAGATDVAVNTPVTLYFSRPVNIATVAANVSVIETVSTLPVAYVTTYALGNQIVILTFAPDLNPSIEHTVAIATGLTDSLGVALDQPYSRNFTTSADSTPDISPHVLDLTRFPYDLVTNVSINQPYVEVTFSKPVNPATVTGASFTISGGVAAGVPTTTDNRTWQLPLNTLAFSTAYTVDVTAAIQDASGNALTADSWSFTTEADPNLLGPDPTTISSISTNSVTTDSAWIHFTTDVPENRNQCYIQYDTTTGTFGNNSPVEPDWDGDGVDEHSFHRVEIPSIPGLAQNTIYYYRVWVDVDSSGTVTAGDLTSAEFTFVTKDTPGGTSNELSSNAGSIQDGHIVLQNSDGSGYVFWIDDTAGDDIYGQYFNTTGAPQWGDPGGAAVSSFGTNQNTIRAITMTNGDIVMVYQDGTSLFGKRLYNTGAPTFRWGGPAGGQGTTIGGVTIAGGSTHSVAYGYTTPIRLVGGGAGTTWVDMPANGVATTLLFDKDTDFSALGLANNDLLVYKTAPTTYAQTTIFNTDSWNEYDYVVRTAGAPNLPGTDFYVANQVSTVVSTASTIIDATTFRYIGTLAGVGDIVNCNGTWAIVTNAVTIAGALREVITDINHGLGVGNPITIYPAITGMLTSEAVINPLWDENPTTLLGPGTLVFGGDLVVNENTNAAPATWTNVAPINLAEDSNYALQLDADIMDHDNSYAIVRLTTSGTGDGNILNEVGYSTATGANQLNDGNATFITNGVAVDDYVFNIDDNTFAQVTAVNSENQLTLDTDIFGATNLKYITYSRFIGVAFITPANDVSMAFVRALDGAAAMPTLSITTTGTSSNPFALSGLNGTIMVFYEQSGTVYGKLVDGSGTLSTNWVSADPGAVILAGGYTITQVLPDGAGGAYVLAHDGASAIRLVRVNGATGGVTWTQSQTGESPHIAIDDVGASNRVALTFKRDNGDGTFYVRAVGYNSGGGTYLALTNISTPALTYSTTYPRVMFTDTNTGATNGFYIVWYDARYLIASGYGLFAQQFDAAGTAQWASELFINSPITTGLPSTLGLELRFYNDGGAAQYGLMPIWYDYNDSATNTGLYREIIDDTGSF